MKKASSVIGTGLSMVKVVVGVRVGYLVNAWLMFPALTGGCIFWPWASDTESARKDKSKYPGDTKKNALR